MKLCVCIPEQIIAACVLLPTLSINGLRMESFQYISRDNNNCQSINLIWKLNLRIAW